MSRSFNNVSRISRPRSSFRRPYLEIIRGTPPFIAMLLLATVLLILFPPIALFLRDLAFR